MAERKVITKAMLVAAVELIENGTTQRDAARKGGFTAASLREHLGKPENRDLRERVDVAMSTLHWTEEQFAQAVRLAGRGLDDRVIAQTIGLDEYTMRDARARSARLREAMDTARRSHRQGRRVPAQRDDDPAAASGVLRWTDGDRPQ